MTTEFLIVDAQPGCPSCGSKPTDEIDPNIQNLVDALNELPGIDTVESCGGHADAKEDDGRCAEGEFYVAFDVDVLWGGWFSLELITECIRDYALTHNLSLLEAGLQVKTWIHGCGLCFALEGTNGADPDALAALLRMPLEDRDEAVKDGPRHVSLSAALPIGK